MYRDGIDFNRGLPLKEKIKDTAREIFRSKEEKAQDKFETVIYFKVIPSKYNDFFKVNYLVVYDNFKIINPSNLTLAQLRKAEELGKGYIGFMTKKNTITGDFTKRYASVGLSRAHKLPCNVDVDFLAENGMALPLPLSF